MLCDLSYVRETINAAIVDDPPAVIRNGGVIRDGFSRNSIRSGGSQHRAGKWILELQQRERERTGIKSLKVAYNSVFSTISRSAAPEPRTCSARIPEKKQTTSNGERFTIAELKEKEAVISTADERQLSLEQDVYRQLLERLNGAVLDLQSAARGIALRCRHCTRWCCGIRPLLPAGCR